MDDATAAAYNSHFNRLEPVLPRSSAPPAVFVPGTAAEAVCPGYDRSPFYNDWARPNDLHQIAFVTAEAPRGGVASLVLVGGRRDRRFGNPAQMRLLETVGRHLGRLVAIAERARDLERYRRCFLAALEPSAVIVLDGRLQVLHATRAAQEILDLDDGLAIGAGGIRARHPASNRLLAAALARARAQARNGVPVAQTLRLQRPSLGPPYIARIAALPGDGPAASASPPWATGGGAILVTIIDPTRGQPAGADALRQAFDLTPAEAAVALRVFAGDGLRAAAADLGVAVSTVRTHLQRVFAKAGVNRQAELVRLIARIVADTRGGG